MRSGERPPSTLALADGWVDLDTRTVVRGSVRQRLSRSEAELLRWLAERPRRDVPRNVLHREVLGVSPRVVTRAVDHLVARLRRKIEINPAEPRHLLTAHGVGYRFVPAEPGRAEQGSLPRAAPPLVGRAAELERIEQRFDAGAGLVTLVGGAGVGKTRLAVEYAHRSADAGKRVTFVDLCVCGATTDFVPALALALGASPEDVDRALSADASHLIVLDNAEHLLPDFAGELSLLLARPDRPRWIVTSREALRIAGEECVEVGALAIDAALTLFLGRARALGVEVDPDSDKSLRVCELLEGRPWRWSLRQAVCRPSDWMAS